MGAQLSLADYRRDIHLDEPSPVTGPRLRGVNPLSLPTIAQAYPESAYPAGRDTVLWRGDLTLLAASAVVTAANAQLSGCTIPNHPCIDYTLNQMAGPQVLLDCRRIIELQGGPEATGQAKLTRGYGLPAKFVIHTVGPIIHGAVRDEDRELLASCYRSSLDLAREFGGLCTIGFCAISTGVFAFPKEEAATIALQAVSDWLTRNPGVLNRVVFAAFTAKDLEVYARVVQDWPTQP